LLFNAVHKSACWLSLGLNLSPTLLARADELIEQGQLLPFCSATAPSTFSNTGRIASIACAIRCTASTEPSASFCRASIFW
jgi:hypothetical protein